MVRLPPPMAKSRGSGPPHEKADKRTTTPSIGFSVLPAKSAQVIVTVSAYLTDTFRSQSFSLSQRFHPTLALWIYFVPHPPIGFERVFRAFPAQPAVTPLGALYSPAVMPAPVLPDAAESRPRPKGPENDLRYTTHYSTEYLLNRSSRVLGCDGEESQTPR